MKNIKENNFLAWANQHGIELDKRYPEANVLVFNSDSQRDRFWIIPSKPERRPYFIASMLELLGEWKSCFVWRHSGSWPKDVDPLRINDHVEFQILKGLGLPLGTTDVIEYLRGEMNQLITLLFSSSIFGWSVCEDLHVIADHAQLMLQTDHHGVIHLSCRNGADLECLIKKMNDRGFPLPTHIPDATFKYPDWMKKKI